MKNILIISPEPFNFIYVSKHHYAITLAHFGNNVYFLNPPNKKAFDSFQLQQTSISNLFIVNYPGQIIGLKYFPSIFRKILNRKFLDKLEKILSIDFDIIWLFENSRFYDLNSFTKSLNIYHQVDLNQNYNLRRAASVADICFCTSDLINQKIIKFNNLVYKIHHGTSEKSLAYKYATSQKKDSKVTAIYIGNLDMPYIDHNLMYDLVALNPDVDFIFIGPFSNEGLFFSKLYALTNISWLGVIDSSEIPNYLNLADIFLVAYAEQFHTDQSSPHKFMEYFARGNVIVSTFTDEYKDKRDLLLMADKNIDLVNLFSYAKSNLILLNSEENVLKRRKFASENSYLRQVSKISDLLLEHFNISLTNSK